jgi:hypothetical protein
MKMKNQMKNRLNYWLGGAYEDGTIIEVSGENAMTQEEAIANEVVRKIEDSTTEIHLTSDGDLYKKPRRKYTHHFNPGTGRYKLLKLLSENFIQTATLSEKLGNKSEQTIRTDVKIINRDAKYKLNLTNDLVEGKRRSGYRISPNYLMLHE